MVPPRSCPPIFNIVLLFLTQRIYRTWILSKDKTIEIRLWEFGWESLFDRVLKRYSHPSFVFRMVKPLRIVRKGEGRTNMATLGRTLGPFGNARAAYDAADKEGLKFGMTVEELEVYMTREWKILKGPR